MRSLSLAVLLALAAMASVVTARAVGDDGQQVQNKGQTFVKTITALEIDPADSVIELKNKIKQREGIPIDQQRLIFDGKQLEDGKLLSDYGVESDSTINLIVRRRGGAEKQLTRTRAQ